MSKPKKYNSRPSDEVWKKAGHALPFLYCTQPVQVVIENGSESDLVCDSSRYGPPKVVE